MVMAMVIRPDRHVPYALASVLLQEGQYAGGSSGMVVMHLAGPLGGSEGRETSRVGFQEGFMKV